MLVRLSIVSRVECTSRARTACALEVLLGALWRATRHSTSNRNDWRAEMKFRRGPLRDSEKKGLGGKPGGSEEEGEDGQEELGAA